MTGQAMNEHATPAFWHESWSALLPYSRRGQVLVAVRLLAVLALVGFAVTTPSFFTAVSLFSLLNTTSFIGCVAVGMTFITLSGNIMSFSLAVTLSDQWHCVHCRAAAGPYRRADHSLRLRRVAHGDLGFHNRIFPRQSHYCEYGGFSADHRMRDADHTRTGCLPRRRYRGRAERADLRDFDATRWVHRYGRRCPNRPVIYPLRAPALYGWEQLAGFSGGGFGTCPDCARRLHRRGLVYGAGRYTHGRALFQWRSGTGNRL